MFRLICPDQRSPLLFLFLALALLSFTACAPVLSFDDPSLRPLVPVAGVSSENLLAWSPDSSMVALDSRGVILVDVVSGQSRRVSERPSRLAAWGRAGLALAYPLGEKTSLQIQLEEDASIQHLEVDGIVTAMAWSSSGLLYALVNRHTYYRFGVNQQTLLLRLSVGQEPAWELLADVTLDPSTPALVGDGFPYGPQLELSPLEDEILYSRLHDPPAFAAEYRVFIRHLETGRERLLGSHGLSGGTARLFKDGESVLLCDESLTLRKMILWGEGEERLAQEAGTTLDVAGDLVYADGALYRGGERLWKLARPLSGRFSPDGSRLAILGQGHLYVLEVAASNDASGFRSPSAQVLKLRRLRALELISPAEYRRYREE